MDKQLIKKIALIVAAILLVAFVVWIIVASLTKEDEVKNREYDKAEVEK